MAVDASGKLYVTNNEYPDDRVLVFDTAHGNVTVDASGTLTRGELSGYRADCVPR